MRILRRPVLAELGRHVLGVHSIGGARPRLAFVAGGPNTTHRDTEHDAPAVVRMNADRMDPGRIVAATDPFFSRGHLPQAGVQLPALPAVVASEETSRDRPRPKRPFAIVARALDAPKGFQCFVGAFGILGDRDLGPRRAVVFGAVQLRAEMPQVETRVNRVVSGIGENDGHRIAHEARAHELPRPRPVAHVDEQAFAGTYQKSISHDVLNPQTRPASRRCPGR